MRWCNEHPDERFDENTLFLSLTDKRGLMVSEAKEIHLLPGEEWFYEHGVEGWGRIMYTVGDACLGWFCKKGDRTIFID